MKYTWTIHKNQYLIPGQTVEKSHMKKADQALRISSPDRISSMISGSDSTAYKGNEINVYSERTCSSLLEIGVEIF